MGHLTFSIICANGSPDRFESKDKKLMAKQSYMLLNYKADSLFMLLNADIVSYTKSRLAFNLVDSHFYKL